MNLNRIRLWKLIWLVRYEHSFFASKLESEFENIYKLKDFIEKAANERVGRISGYRLE